MGEYEDLISLRKILQVKLRALEITGEGMENEVNIKKVHKLETERNRLRVAQESLTAQAKKMKIRLDEISESISQIGDSAESKILEAIKNQRWYFFKNKPEVFFDRETGLLWANLDYFPYCPEDCSYYSNRDDALQAVKAFKGDGYRNWRLPSQSELIKMIDDCTFPFYAGYSHCIKSSEANVAIVNKGDSLVLDSAYPRTVSTKSGVCIPCDDTLVKDSTYASDVTSENHVYSEKEKLRFTLNLFVQNGLQPIFEDDSITALFKQQYLEKPALMEQIQTVQTKLDALQDDTPLSSKFDYQSLLTKYDIPAINHSTIRFYGAVQQWTQELMKKLDEYEMQKETTITRFNAISLALTARYHNDPHLEEDENVFLEKRQQDFQKRFALGLERVKRKLINFREQADNLERQLDEMEAGPNLLAGLAQLEREPRPSFSFVAEDTAKIIRNALYRIEFFEAHEDLVKNAIAAWSQWTEDYRVFKTTYREDLKNSCEEDGIGEDVWSSWYSDWQKIRFLLEQKMQPVVDWGLKEDIPAVQPAKKPVPEEVLEQLGIYKEAVDNFFLKERKGIYQKYAFAPGAELQEKFETENELNKLASAFRNALQPIMFNCKRSEDRMFLLKWASPLMDIQVESVLQFVRDAQLSDISQEILQEFAQLKKKNYDTLLNDAKAYGEAQKERDKQFNQLIFKMRTVLAKKGK